MTFKNGGDDGKTPVVWVPVQALDRVIQEIKNEWDPAIRMMNLSSVKLRMNPLLTSGWEDLQKLDAEIKKGTPTGSEDRRAQFSAVVTIAYVTAPPMPGDEQYNMRAASNRLRYRQPTTACDFDATIGDDDDAFLRHPDSRLDR